MDMDIAALLQAARAARERAYAPYSRFAVGAAVLTASGRIFTGCNVENAAYSMCICAERTAIVSAVAAGERDIVALAVIADTARPVSPCGACRQMMVELNPSMRVIMANMSGEVLETTAQELLPGAFTAQDLQI